MFINKTDKPTHKLVHSIIPLLNKRLNNCSLDTDQPKDVIVLDIIDRTLYSKVGHVVKKYQSDFLTRGNDSNFRTVLRVKRKRNTSSIVITEFYSSSSEGLPSISNAKYNIYINKLYNSIPFLTSIASKSSIVIYILNLGYFHLYYFVTLKLI